ncbi:MAG TPA: S53 family peptidase [Thermoplasmata archaeon]|nr:S53 family peptidase [Thermoplasmata archaeon]
MAQPSSAPVGKLHELPGSRRGPISGARDAGVSPKDEPVDVSVFLRRGSAPSEALPMEQLGATLLTRRKYLSRVQFAAIHSARADDVARLKEYALREGLSVGLVDRARRLVKLSGTTADLGHAFGVELHRFEHPSTPYRAPVGPVQLPEELKDAVVGVFGLDSRPQLRPHFRRNADPQATGYSPLSVASAYEFPPDLSGTGQCIGLLEFGGGFSPDDLSSYFGVLGVRVPEVVSVGLDGATNAPTGDPNGPDAEVELDVEVAGALAPDARLVVYFAPNTEQGFVDAITSSIHDAANRPSVVSISWGGPEESWSPQARRAFEVATQDGALQGVTILAAAGDQGASDGAQAGTREVDFPASSPFVVGCGGTRLELSGGKIVSEVVWNELAKGEGATGGGVSEAFARPVYQSASSVPSAPNGFVGRGVPDVAGDADPSTGYSVVVDGASAVIGGTSAVAPLWAALVARLAQGLGKPLGYANPLLYSPSVAGALRDITAGNNGGYSAGPGWDACTGLGSPRGNGLLAALQA